TWRTVPQSRPARLPLSWSSTPPTGATPDVSNLPWRTPAARRRSESTSRSM
ncbi:hypothetical protein Bbelb_334730, partial [Branchiostoma belcheri]